MSLLVENHCSLNDLAASMPAVRSNLLSQEQAAYSLAWCQLSNPNASRLPTFYSGIGSDLTTVSLATNSCLLVCSEAKPLSLDLLNIYLDQWEVIDDPKPEDIDLKRAIRNKVVQTYTWMPIMLNGPQLDAKVEELWAGYEQHPEDKKRSIGRFIEDFHNLRDIRLQKGYYLSEGYDVFDLERMLVVELKALGVEKDDIKEISANDVDGTVTLKFLWQHPFDSEAKVRKFVIKHSTETQGIFKTLPSSEYPLFECYFEKSNNQPITDYQRLRAQMSPGSMMLIGKQLVSTNVFRFPAAYFGRGVEVCDVADAHIRSMQEFIEKCRLEMKNDPEYGWRLKGLILPT